MIWLRRGVLELWAMVMLAVVVGFLCPFGTYLDAAFPERVWTWFIHLMGAYVLVRPAISLLSATADATLLPKGMLVFWGVLLSGFPLTLVWVWGGSLFFQALGGFAGVLPFALLSAVTILVVVWWARKIDERIAQAPFEGTASTDSGNAGRAADTGQEGIGPVAGPRLEKRLSKAFRGPIIALQSEDHYVRVHGPKGSELVLMRLRDAVAELDSLSGEQVHRSWWVAKDAVASVDRGGRSRIITLIDGQTVPIARDSIASLERKGFFGPDKRA